VAQGLNEYDAKWTVATSLDLGPANVREEDAVTIAEDSRLTVQGHIVDLNNLVPDSRGTVMDYSEWRRLLLGKKPVEEDQLRRMAFLGGGAGTIYPFQSDGGNCGFVIINTEIPKSWAEVWDSSGIRRIRADFECPLPTADEASALAEELARLGWPENLAKQVAPSDGDKPSN